MSHRILPQQREVKNLYDAQFSKLKEKCEINQALKSPYKQTMAPEHPQIPREKPVPLMNTIMEGDGFQKVPQEPHKIKLSRYEAQRIHFRGFVPDEELGVNIKEKKTKDPMSREAREESLRRVSTPNFVQENKRILRKMSETIAGAKAEQSRPQSAAAQHRTSFNSSRPSTRRGGMRPASARAGSSHRQSFASQPVDFDSPRAQQQLFVGQSPNTPGKVRYQPTYRHAEIITTCERAAFDDSMGATRRGNNTNMPLARPFSASTRKNVPDYDTKPHKQISGFSINTKGAMASRPLQRKAHIENRSNPDAQSYYNFKDNVRKHREPEPQGPQIKMAIHSAVV